MGLAAGGFRALHLRALFWVFQPVLLHGADRRRLKERRPLIVLGGVRFPPLISAQGNNTNNKPYHNEYNSVALCVCVCVCDFDPELQWNISSSDQSSRACSKPTVFMSEG